MVPSSARPPPIWQKGVINSLTVSIAEEYAKYGVRCNAILPGFMDTPLGLWNYKKPGAEERVRSRAMRNCLPESPAMAGMWRSRRVPRQRLKQSI